MLRRLLVLVISSLAASSLFAAPLTEAEANDIGVEAYLFFYPIVTMDLTRKQLTNIEAGKIMGRGPVNTFVHMREFPGAQFKEVVRPNFDTLYSSAWLDLNKEPVIVSVPNTNGRYYLLPMMDMWTDVFAAPGSRTSGTEENHFAVVPPHWRGKLPAKVQRIDAPTPYVWIIGRTQTNGPQDYPAVHKVQDGYLLTPLSQWGRTKKVSKTAVQIDQTVDMKTPVLDQVNRMSAEEFFKYGIAALKRNPAHLTDWSQMERLKRVGMEAGKEFSFEKLEPMVRKAVSNATAEGSKAMFAKLPTLAPVVNAWQMNVDTMGVYGNFYLKRAIVAMLGLGANQPEDAVYPLALADGEAKELVGTKNYVIRFKKDEMPPVSAFWSITMYDDKGFQAENAINRFAIGDRDKLKYNTDGSLDIYIQHENPGADKESNWLPAPKTKLGITMRLYGPKASVISGRWAPPLIRKN